jgi:hypothetical protein
MIPPLRGKAPTSVPSDLNFFYTSRWHMRAPLLADDYMRACAGTNLRWDALCLFHMVRTDFGRNTNKDPFGIGFEGSPEEMAINASIHCQELTRLDELPGDERFWQQLGLVWEQWLVFARRMQEQREGQPLPEPPPPPPPPKPPEPVKPQPEPPKPPTPELPKPPTAVPWKKICATLSGVLGAAIIAAKLFAPGWVALALEAIRQLLAALGG